MGVGDFILVGLRSYQDEKCDVLHVYHSDEARRLRKMGELPVDAKMEEEERGVNQGNMTFEIGEDLESLSGESIEAQPDRYGPKKGSGDAYFDYDLISSESVGSEDFENL